jgi:hypothetical protein
MFHNDAAMQVSTSRWRMAKMKHHSLHFDDEHVCPSVFDMSKSPERNESTREQVISSSFRVFFPDRSHKSGLAA